MKRIIIRVMLVLIIFISAPEIFAQGLFGRPQGYSKDGKGLYTTIGIIHGRNMMGKDRSYLITERIIFSEAGYGLSRGWEIYGRIGYVDGNISGPIGPSYYTVSTTDLRADDRLLATAGFRWSYPIDPSLRIGVSMQGSYYLNDGSDEVIGIRPDGRRTWHEIRLKREWILNGTLGLQASLPGGLKFYAGPYFQHGEGKMISLPAIPGWEEKIRSRYLLGVYGGLTAPMVKRFSLTFEGWYGKRLSLGSMINYTY